MGKKNEDKSFCLSCHASILSGKEERPLVRVFWVSYNGKVGRFTIHEAHNRHIGVSSGNGGVSVKGRGSNFIAPESIIGVAHETCVPASFPNFPIVGNIGPDEARRLALSCIRGQINRQRTLQSA